ncbi:hypothetical protein BGLT_01224 [Caballeronia glathei]|nr:hypothetical protein BGLT_01224 [Caballeronia glathei]
MTRKRRDELLARHPATLDGDLQNAPLDRAYVRNLLLHIGAQPVDGSCREANGCEFALNRFTHVCKGGRTLAFRGAGTWQLVKQFTHSRKDSEAVLRQLFQARFVHLVRIRRLDIAGVIGVRVVGVVRVRVDVLCRGRIRRRHLVLYGFFVEAVDQFVDTQFTRRNLLRIHKDRRDSRRAGRNCLDHLVKPVFDTLRNRDLTRAGQQLGRTHFTHVHTHGIGRAAELGVDSRERDFRFFVRLVVQYGRRRRVVQKQRLRVGRLLIDGHAHVIERADNAFDGSGLRDVVGQMIVDFRVGQEASLLAQLDQGTHLTLTLFVQRGGCGVHRHKGGCELALRRATDRGFPS